MLEGRLAQDADHCSSARLGSARYLGLSRLSSALVSGLGNQLNARLSSTWSSARAQLGAQLGIGSGIGSLFGLAQDSVRLTCLGLLLMGSLGALLGLEARPGWKLGTRLRTRRSGHWLGSDPGLVHLGFKYIINETMHERRKTNTGRRENA